MPSSPEYRRSDKNKAAQKRYRESPKGRHNYRAAQKRYHHSGRGREAVRRYQQTAKGQAAQARAIARRANAISTLTGEEWELITEMYGSRCVYCYDHAKLTVEHIVPLSRGGSNTFDNVVPSCQSCNSSKGAKPLLIWMYDQIAA